jgi:thioredoxin reductase (NADPH)
LIYDAIILGAGPAGLTAAMYALRSGLNILIIESPFVISQASYAAIVENFPGFINGISGGKFVSNLKEQVGNLGASISSAEVRSIEALVHKGSKQWRINLDEKHYDALSVIVATGASAKRLGLEGEDRLIGKGVSYCAICDGIFFKDKDIAIIGGGDSALEEALFLSGIAKKVTVIHRRNKLRAVKLLQDKVFSNKKIDIKWDSVVTAISGENKVSGLRLENVITRIPEDFNCDGVFISIGKTPNTYFLQDTLALEKQGYIITNKNLQTSRQGVFACGDCRDTLFRQIVTACADGALAAEMCRHHIDTIKASKT